MKTLIVIAVLLLTLLAGVVIYQTVIPSGLIPSPLPSIEKKHKHPSPTPVIPPLLYLLDPQLVGYSYSAFATGWNTQRKVWDSNGSENIWVAYWYGYKSYADALFWFKPTKFYNLSGTLSDWDNQEKGASSTLAISTSDFHYNSSSLRALTVTGQNALVMKNFTLHNFLSTRVYLRVSAVPPSDKIGWFFFLRKNATLDVALGLKNATFGKQWVLRYYNTTGGYSTNFSNFTWGATDWYGLTVDVNTTAGTLRLWNASAYGTPNSFLLQNVTGYSASAEVNRLQVGVNSTGSETGAMGTYIGDIVVDDSHVDFEPADTSYYMYTSSANGLTWATPIQLLSKKRAWAYLNWAESIDVNYEKDSNNMTFPFYSEGDLIYFYKFYVNANGTLTRVTSALGASMVNFKNIGGREARVGNALVLTLSTMYTGAAGFPPGPRQEVIYRLNWKTWGSPGAEYADKIVNNYTTTTGGSTNLRLNDSMAIYVVKLANNKLYYNFTNWAASRPMLIPNSPTLTDGFTSFSASSQYEYNYGDKILLAYIKSTGELAAMNFSTSQGWGTEKVLTSSASCPVVASGQNGYVYYFYIKNSRIKLLYTNGKDWSAEIDAFPNHTFHNPNYLTTNQISQNGKVLLAWTEDNVGVEPYAVWFSYLDDTWSH